MWERSKSDGVNRVVRRRGGGRGDGETIDSGVIWGKHVIAHHTLLKFHDPAADGVVVRGIKEQLLLRKSL